MFVLVVLGFRFDELSPLLKVFRPCPFIFGIKSASLSPSFIIVEGLVVGPEIKTN